MRLPTSWQPPGSQLMHIILQWIDTMGWREGMENCNIMMSSQARVTRQDGSLPLMDHLTRLPLQPVLFDHSISFSLSLQWTRWTPLRYREQLDSSLADALLVTFDCSSNINIKGNVPTLDQAEIDWSKQKSEQWIYRISVYHHGQGRREEASLVVSGELQEAFIVIIICQILEQSLCWAGGGKCWYKHIYGH